MFHHPGGKRHGDRARRGQSMIEFALCVPVFILLVFGIFQAALIYKAQIALNQAAADSVQALAAQSSDGATSGGDTQADASGLAFIRQALSSMSLSGLSGACLDGTSPPCSSANSPSGIDIFSDDGTGNPAAVQVNNSHDLSNGPYNSVSNIGAGSSCTSSSTMTTNFACISLDNHYVYQQNSSLCKVDLDGNGNYNFSLTNSLDNSSPSPSSALIITSGSTGTVPWNSCALPWNGRAFDTTRSGNQNGRDDQRCQEATVSVKIRYNYFSSVFPVHWGIQLVGSASVPMEPRQYIGNSATTQTTVGTC